MHRLTIYDFITLALLIFLRYCFFNPYNPDFPSAHIQLSGHCCMFFFFLFLFGLCVSRYYKKKKKRFAQVHTCAPEVVYGDIRIQNITLWRLFIFLFAIFFSLLVQKTQNANKRISFSLRCFLSAFFIFVHLFAFLCFCLVAFLCFSCILLLFVLFGAFC